MTSRTHASDVGKAHFPDMLLLPGNNGSQERCAVLAMLVDEVHDKMRAGSKGSHPNMKK